MKMICFAKRCFLEILRDPICLFFGLCFPVVVLLLLMLIQANVPQAPFRAESLAPAMVIFGYSFLSLLSGQLIAKDRGSSFLTRLIASPLSSGDFILGYTLPLLPFALMQVICCFAAAILLGMPFSVNLFLCIAVSLPCALLYLGIGLFAGCVFTERQVGGFCGALLVNLSAWLGGMWFDPAMLGGAFGTVARILPFANAVDAVRAGYMGDLAALGRPLLIVSAYAAALVLLAIWTFARKTRGRKS